MHWGALNGILEKRGDINGKTGEFQMKSGVYLIIIYQYSFLVLTNVPQ